MGRKENREKVFSPGPKIFILPNREESAVKALLSKYPLPMSTTTQRGKIRKKQKITTKPSTTTKHWNLAQKTKTYHNQNRNSKPNQKI